MLFNLELVTYLELRNFMLFVCQRKRAENAVYYLFNNFYIASKFYLKIMLLLYIEINVQGVIHLDCTAFHPSHHITFYSN